MECRHTVSKLHAEGANPRPAEEHYKIEVRLRGDGGEVVGTGLTEARDIMKAIGIDRDYNLAEAFAHIFRAPLKGCEREDAQKAIRHLEFYLEELSYE